MVDEETLRVYAAKAEDYARLVANSEPDPDLLSFLADLPKAARILDLGCGPATASAFMRAAGHTPDPVDASQQMVALANRLHDLGARVLSFDDLDASEAYDGVWANFSLLHAPRADLPRHMDAIATALVAGGVLHLGMKLGSGEARDALGRAYTYVSTPELAALVTAAGFDVIATREGAEVGLAGTRDPFVIMRARKSPDA